MAWWGTHSEFTRQQARAILPPGHCRMCNYWCRFIMHRDSLKYLAPESKCTRCGCTINVIEILYAARRLGFIPMTQQIKG
jgi:hypothetical protein